MRNFKPKVEAGLQRSWIAPYGRNIVFESFLAPMPLEPARISGLSLAVAVVVAEVLEELISAKNYLEVAERRCL